MYFIQYYVPFCVVWLPVRPLKPPKPESPPKCKPQRGGNMNSIKWEEVYDAVDGTKTWYNTVTKKTTKIDPFY